MNLLAISAITFLLNIPFGYWRANERKLSLQWLLAVHLPVPAVAVFRSLAGLGWELKTFPVLVGAFFLGQFVGGRVHSWLRSELKVPITSCLVWDVVRSLRVKER